MASSPRPSSPRARAQAEVRNCCQFCNCFLFKGLRVTVLQNNSVRLKCELGLLGWRKLTNATQALLCASQGRGACLGSQSEEVLGDRGAKLSSSEHNFLKKKSQRTDQNFSELKTCDVCLLSSSTSRQMERDVKGSRTLSHRELTQKHERTILRSNSMSGSLRMEKQARMRRPAPSSHHHLFKGRVRASVPVVLNLPKATALSHSSPCRGEPQPSNSVHCYFRTVTVLLLRVMM